MSPRSWWKNPPCRAELDPCLVVKEGKGDQVIQATESGLDKVLRVMTRELQNGEHGKTSILQLVELEFLNIVLSNWLFTSSKVAKETTLVDE